MQDTTLTIKQTLDIDPEINFINWELNVQDVASTTERTIAGAQGLLGLVITALIDIVEHTVACMHYTTTS